MRSPLMMTPPSWIALFGKENRLQHFRRGVAIHRHAGLDGLLQLDGLLDGDERADFHLGQAFDGLDDDLDAFALFARGGEQRQVAQLGQHPAQFRLENDQHATAKNAENVPSSQRNTCKSKMVVTSASASNTTTNR
jgi:hypothetical protein